MSDSSPIMIFRIKIDKALISSFSTPEGRVTVIPFTGNVESDLFTGEILPGAADVQTSDPNGLVHMCARYMFSGKDRDGRECHLFVENNGSFHPGQTNGSIVHACPKFITDSEALSGYLSKPVFRTEIHPSEDGVDIKVFDTGSIRKEY